MADTEAKKILEGLWADGGDRTDPDDATLTPVLDRDIGWPASFSAASGDTPRRRVMNQLFRELNGAASDAMRYGGVYPYDDEIDYFEHARCSDGANEYRAVAANGPSSTVVGPTDAGQTTWVLVEKTLAVPAKNPTPTGMASGSRQIRWQWDLPADNGSAITEFNFQWRQEGASVWTDVDVNYSSYLLTGLTNGTTYEARVRSVNSQGDGEWSDVATAAAAGTVPGGGETLALRAESGNGEVSLSWLEPDTGGLTLSPYVIQWKSGTQAFSSARQTTSNTTSVTVDSLTNGTEYDFRVRAVNSAGNGAWSNTASATPMLPVTDSVPSRAAFPSPSAGNAEMEWTVTPPDDGGAQITSYQWRWRRVTNPVSTWTMVVTGTSTVLSVDSLVNGAQYEAQVRATNSVGQQTAYSPSGIGVPRAEVPDDIRYIDLESSSAGISCAWGEPDNNGAAITGYNLQWDTTDTFDSNSGNPLDSVTQTGRTRNVIGLSNGTTYYFRVRASNSAGNGSWSPTFSLEKTAVQPTVNTPTLTAEAGGVSIEWSLDQNGGSSVQGYLIRHRLNANPYAYGNIALDDVSPYFISSLSGNLRAQVMAFNEQNGGPWSDEALITVASQAYAGFVDTNNDNFRLATLDLSTGALTAVGNLQDISTLVGTTPQGIGIITSSGNVYAGFVDDNVNNFRFTTLNLSTGTLIPVGNLQNLSSILTGGVYTGFGIIESGGIVYAGFIDSNLDHFRLATINLSTGALTAVGNTQSIATLVGGSPQGIGMVESGGTIYTGFVDSSVDRFRLASLNLTTGALTAIGNTQSLTTLLGNNPSPLGVGLIESGGTVYAGFISNAFDNFQLATVNLSTAVLTSVGNAQDISTLVGTTPAGLGLLLT